MVSLVCSEASPSVAAELGGRDFYAPVLRSGYLGSDVGAGGGGRMAPTVPTLDLGVPDWSTPCCAPLARPRLSEDTGVA